MSSEMSNKEVEFCSEFERSFISPKKIKTFPLKIKQTKTSETGNSFGLKEKNEELVKKRIENIQRRPLENF